VTEQVRRLAFSDVLEDVSGGSLKTPQSEFLREGRFPVVDQGKALVSGYVDDPGRVCRAPLPVIVFGDHTRCFKYVDFPFCMGADGIKVLRPRIEVDLKYLYHCLRQLPLPDGGYDRHFKYLKRTQILLPSDSEQRRVAALLDFAESLRRKRSRVDQLREELVAAVFSDCFGPLRTFPVTVDAVATHAAGWSWVPLVSVAKLATGHTPDRSVPGYWGSGTPWISLTDIRKLDGKMASVTAEEVTDDGIANSAAVKLPRGTVCLSRTASIGFVTVMGREMATSQDFVNWVCGPDLDPIYLMHALLRSRTRLRSLAPGSTHKTIYFPTVEQFRVLLPPAERQRHFAERMRGIEALAVEQTASTAAHEALLASLRSRSFSRAT
jgi:type I restriction enzyme S subunit